MYRVWVYLTALSNINNYIQNEPYFKGLNVMRFQG